MFENSQCLTGDGGRGEVAEFHAGGYAVQNSRARGHQIKRDEARRGAEKIMTEGPIDPPGST